MSNLLVSILYLTRPTPLRMYINNIDVGYVRGLLLTILPALLDLERPVR